MSVAVVTDSTSYLPPGVALQLSVRVVPLHVQVGSASHLDGVSLSPAQLAVAMSDRVPVSTSAASVAELAAAYRATLEAGASSVVAVHLSRRLSATCDSALVAANELGGPDVVRVVDSATVGMGLGFAVQAAAAAAARGASGVDVASAAVAAACRTSTYFCVDTLEHLRRGGRIGAATALLGTALAVKPLLHVVDGRIEALEKVRTASRATARLAELAAGAAGDGPVRVAVHHLAAAQRAAQLAQLLHHRLPGLADCVTCEIGAVLGAHTGPGVLGVVLLRGGGAPL